MAAFENFQEVWAALGRLNDSIMRLEEAQQRAVIQYSDQFAQVTERIDQLTERIDRLVSTVATLAGTVAQLATVSESHERRLARLEGQ
jgi:predicted  nucleic acid-binding Zn-ribbon protein